MNPVTATVALALAAGLTACGGGTPPPPSGVAAPSAQLGSTSQSASSSDKTTQAKDDIEQRIAGISTTGPCSWLSASEVEKATGSTTVSAQSLTFSCVYGMGFPKSVTSMLAPDPSVFEENKAPSQGNVISPPSALSGLGVDAYCINIGELAGVPGGGRINVKLANGKVYQIWGTYSCDQLLPLAKIAITRV